MSGGQFDWGGRLPKSNGGAQRFPQRGWKSRAQSVKAEGSLTARHTGRAGTKVGLSDPAAIEWKSRRSTDKSYPGDNRLISPKSPHRRGGLAPRCRLIASWGGSTSQGLGCSPIKAVRELGSERRETVRSLSVAGAGDLRGAVPSTRGPGWTDHWRTSYRASGSAGYPYPVGISAEGI
ncbi:hypothetical protein SPSYN_02288 [Sporotomaculum syntrophicum]|uniref:Uncharacterized protein n=1 Tax=Sporotomaculum syntrophicum TaxID=182264 RepID=A0A9D2WN72_9FIRM|nr:hypothetical protein SPSYN_03131 [Sporotomaculum syntrophicum]KAF1084510.1 hypothetical protein SPSYN_02288 [Sporotomaculum syntrophicum]